MQIGLSCLVELKCLAASFTGANSDGFFNGTDKNFAVPDFPGFCRIANGFSGSSHRLIGHNNFQFNFRQKIHRILTATVDLSMAFLSAKPLYLGNGHPFNARLSEGIFYFLKLEWLDDCFDFFHVLSPAR